MFILPPPQDGVFVALELGFELPVIEPFTIKFKNTKYTVLHSKSISLSMHIASEANMNNDIFTDSHVQGFNMPIYSQYFFGGTANKMNNCRRTELLQKLRKTLSDCYAADISIEDIQQVWDFELVDSVHRE